VIARGRITIERASVRPVNNGPTSWVPSSHRLEAFKLVPQMGAVVIDDKSGSGESVDLYARARAYDSVRAVLSDNNNYERGVAEAQGVAAAVLAESGVAGLADMTVELSLKLASALERIAADQGLVAVDLADIWFVD
jgi:hypothetical protein